MFTIYWQRFEVKWYPQALRIILQTFEKPNW